MRQVNRKVCWGLALAAGLGMLAGHAQSAVYTYSESTSTTTQWAAGTSWDVTPVSAADTVLTFNGTLVAGDAVVSNNDIGGNFLLNKLNFNYIGPASGVAPTVTITGNPLEFTGAAAQITYLTTGTGASRPKLIINSDIVLSSNLRVYADTEGPNPIVALNGAITGSGALTFQDDNGSTATYALSNSGNDYTGDTTVAHGGSSGRAQVLSLGAASVLPSGVGRGNLVLSSPGEAGGTAVQLNGQDQMVNGLVAAAPGNGANATSFHTVRNSAGTPATLTFGDADTTATFVGHFTNGSTGSLNLVKDGTGTQTLGGTGNHTGTTTVSKGELVIDYTLYATSKTADPTNYFSTLSPVILDGGTTLTIEGRGDGAAISQPSVGLGQYSRTFTLPNAQADQLVVGQEVIFTKTAGAGIPATDVYITAMDRGVTTTTVYGNKRLGGTGGSTVTVDSLATVATTSQTLHSLTLSGSVGEIATLDFGASDNVVLTINAAPVQLVDGSILNIANWNGIPVSGNGTERLLFVGVPADFSSVFDQSEVTFQGYGAGYTLVDFGGQYEVVPIPEPASLGLIGLAALAGLSRRRRR